MYTCIYIHIHTDTYALHIHIFLYTSLYIHIHTNMHTHVCIYIHLHTLTSHAEFSNFILQLPAISALSQCGGRQTLHISSPGMFSHFWVRKGRLSMVIWLLTGSRKERGGCWWDSSSRLQVPQRSGNSCGVRCQAQWGWSRKVSCTESRLPGRQQRRGRFPLNCCLLSWWEKLLTKIRGFILAVLRTYISAWL